MKLDLNEIAHSVGMHYTYPVDEEEPEFEPLGLTLDAPVRGSLDFFNTGKVIVVRGGLDTVVRLECSRCLTQFARPQHVDVEEELPVVSLGPYPLSEEEQREEEELEEELAVPEELFHENVLDLTELIRQNLLVALPLAPVCREDCRGLCPHCGKDLNSGACSCVSEEEGALSMLKELLSDEDENPEA